MQTNCLLLAGELSQAIYAYYWGFIRYPDDAEIRRCLEYARSRVAYAGPAEREALAPRPDLFAWPTPLMQANSWILVAAIGCISWFCFGRWLVTRRPRWILVFALGLAVACGLAVISLGGHWDRPRYGAVVSEPVILRTGDGPSYLPRREMPLPAGVEVRLITNTGGWGQVELADGTVGWLPMGSLVKFGQGELP